MDRPPKTARPLTAGPEPLQSRPSTSLVDRSPRGERLRTLAQLVRGGAAQRTAGVVQLMQIKGTIVVKGGKVTFRYPSGLEKDIPEADVKEKDLAERNGVSCIAEIVDGVVKAIVSLAYVPPKTAPVVRPTVKIDAAAITHAWRRHTYSGIRAAGAIESDYAGDTVAMFPKSVGNAELTATLTALNGQTLTWTSIGAGQMEVIVEGIKLKGAQVGNEVVVSTAFPTAGTVAKTAITAALTAHASLEDFVANLAAPS